jgi:DNA-binding response OmpR family regulator
MTAMVGGSGTGDVQAETTSSAQARDEVLVVEDDADLQGIVGDVLLGHGYQPRFASDGAAGLAYLRTGGDRVCLVLLDLGLSTMNGFEFLAHQACEPAIQAIPVVVMSGRDGLGATPGLGAWVGTLHKPIGMHELLAEVRRCAVTRRGSLP